MPVFHRATTAGTPQAVNMLWGPAATIPFSTGVSISTTSLNDADNSVAIIFQAPKAGTLNAIGIGINTFTTPPAYNVGFVTLDGSTLPTSTAAGSSTITSYTPTGTGWFWVTMATGLAVAMGDVVCARIWPGATAPTGSSFIAVRKYSNITVTAGLPQVLEFTTAWARQAAMPIGSMAARYTDTTVCGGYPTSGATGQPDGPTFNNVATAPEQGAVFQVPVPMTCKGARFVWDPTAITTAGAVFSLYDSTTTLLASFTAPAASLVTTGNNILDVMWDSAIPLTANTSYRIAMLATDADNRNLPEIQAPDNPSSDAVPEGNRWSQSTRTPPSTTWTDQTSIVPLMAIWVSSIS